MATHAPMPQHGNSQKVIDSGEFDTTHSIASRKYLRSYGLIPPSVESYDVQAQRCLKQLALKSTPIEKYLYLSQLRNTDVHLFYRLAVDHMQDIMPLVYTPVVGEACQKWSDIYSQPEGMYISYADKGRIATVLANWPQDHVEITVVTDGSRILGLGDLGVGGMGIPVGKLALYSACGGIRPECTLPLTIDVGTNNEKLLEDPLYLGSKHKRISDAEELEFLDELMEALVGRWPGIVIQYEDFKNPFPSLEKYQGNYTMFNDDIQGTGAVVLAGIIRAVKESGQHPREHRAVVLGAGSAAVGVAKQIVAYFMSEGLTEQEAKKCFYLVDTKGMVTNDRGDKLAEHKKYFSRDDNKGTQCKGLRETVDYVKPTILLGLSTIGGAFNEGILKDMGTWNKRPIVFPLSNPATNSECTFEEAMTHTEGRALFASGSPFPNWTDTKSGKEYLPGQGNNVYVFPPIGLAAILSKATTITQSMIYASAVALTESLTDAEKEQGLLYPEVKRIRDVTPVVARGVIRAAQEAGVDRQTMLRNKSDAEIEAWIRERMYDPHKETENVKKEMEALTSENVSPAAAAKSRL